MSAPGPYAPYGRAYWRPSYGRIAILVAAVLIGLAVLAMLVFFAPGLFGIAGLNDTYRYSIFGGFFFLLLLLIVIFSVVRVAFWTIRMGGRRSYYGPGGGGYGPDGPFRVARMRFARGEITRDEFDRILDGLGRRPGPP